MTRGSKFGFLISGLALAAVAGILVFRAPLLEILLRSALAYRDVPDADLTVESVALREATFADISLGTAGEVQIAKATIAYDLRGLVAGRIQGLALDGVRLKLDLRAGKPPLGSLQSLAAGSGAEPRAPPALPTITLRDARIEVLTPLGPISGLIDGVLRPGEAGALNATLQFGLQGEAGRLRGELKAERTPDGKTRASLDIAGGALTLPGAELRGLRGGGSLSATGTAIEAAKLDLTLSEVAVPGASFEQTRLTLRLAGARLEIDAEMATGDGQFAVRAKADLADFPARPSGRIQFDAEIGAQAILWPLIAIPPPSKGRADASLTVQGRLPPLASLIGAEAGPLSALKADDFTGRAKLRFSEIDYPGLIQGLSGELRLAARPGAGFPDRLAADMDLTLAAARLTWGDIDAREVAVSQKAILDVSDRKMAVAFGDKGEISAGTLDYAAMIATDGALAARIATATARIDFGAASGLGLVHDVTLAPRAMGFSLSRAGAARLKLQAQAKTLRARGAYTAAAGYTGKVTLAGGQVSVPAYDLAAEGLNATLAFAPGGGIDLAFKLGALRHTAEPPIMSPIGLHGKARQSGGSITFSVEGSGPGALGQATLSGRHGTVDGVGEARIALAPLVFAPGGAQPGALFPALADLRNVDGTVRAGGTLSWTQEAYTGNAALKIDNLSFDSAAARVEGLSLDLALDRIRPPASAPGQTFSVRRIDPGVPIDDLAIRFQVIAGDTPRVAVERAGLRLAGGRFSLADLVVDPASPQQHLPVGVEDLDLGEVFALLGVEGLAGDGRLSGVLPLTVTGGTPRIAGGRLTAQEPGILRIKSDYAEQALASAGESAELLLRALEEFHYEELSLTIDQPSQDLAVIGLTMLGSNPNVRDGYPFRFNVNLETDPRKLIKTLQEAFLISNRAIGQMWMFGR